MLSHAAKCIVFFIGAFHLTIKVSFQLVVFNISTFLVLLKLFKCIALSLVSIEHVSERHFASNLLRAVNIKS